MPSMSCHAFPAGVIVQLFQFCVFTVYNAAAGAKRFPPPSSDWNPQMKKPVPIGLPNSRRIVSPRILDASDCDTPLKTPNSGMSCGSPETAHDCIALKMSDELCIEIDQG